LNKRIHIITGHYGSGKSEIAVNLALALSKKGQNVVFADMDTINPYFRSNEARNILVSKGITVITTKYANTNVDIPALTGELSYYLRQKSAFLIIDVGGDDAGARIVGRYKHEISERDTNLYFVINCFRPETASVDGVLHILEEIRTVSGMKFNAIINNSHLMEATTEKHILKGRDFARRISHITGIPIAFHSIMKKDKISKNILADEPVLWMEKTMGLFL
jgi:cellulose biosynthesis protein BcsQ